MFLNAHIVSDKLYRLFYRKFRLLWLYSESLTQNLQIYVSPKRALWRIM